MEINITNNELDIINDVDITNDEVVELDQYGMPIETIDEEEENELIEMRNLILQKQNNSFINYESKNKKEENNKKKNKKTTISLGELHKLMDQKIMDSKPKKFVSSRVRDKMGEKLDKPIQYNDTRKFNPKMIPYNFRSN